MTCHLNKLEFLCVKFGRNWLIWFLARKIYKFHQICNYLPFEKDVTLHLNLYPLQTRIAKFGSNLPTDSGDEDKDIKSFWESLQFFFQTLKIFSSAGIMTMSISQREDCGFFSSNSLKTWNISLATRTGGMFRLPQPSAGKEILFMPPCTACFRHSSTNFLKF